MADILLVEDDVHMLRVLSMWLERNGHTIAEAVDGLKGQAKLIERSFDLVVSDVNMPGMDGVALVRWLRTKRGSNTPVILLSSRSDQAALMKELDVYGVRVHPKPFSPSRLVAEVQRQLDASAADRTRQEAASRRD